MKRFTAFLLMLSLLVSCFSAQGAEKWSVSWTFDQYALSSYLENCGMEDLVLSLLADLAGGVSGRLRMEGVAMENGLFGQLKVDGEELTWFKAERKNGDITFDADLLSDITLVLHEDDLLAALPNPDDLSSMLLNPILSIVNRENAIVEKGRFWGYAYEAGNVRRTVTLTEDDLNDLMKTFFGTLHDSLSPEVDDGFTEEIPAENLDGARYTGLLSGIWEDNELTGLSFSLFDHDDTVLTMSYGPRENGISLAGGIGLEDANYYADLRLDFEEKILTGSLELYRDHYGIGLESIRSYGMSLGNLIMNVQMLESDEEQAFEAELHIEKEGSSVMTEALNGHVFSDGRVEMKITAFCPGYSVPMMQADFLMENMASELDGDTMGMNDHTAFSISDNDRVRMEFEEAYESDISDRIINGVYRLIPKLMRLVP